MDNTSYSTAGFRNKSILEALDSIQKSGYPSVEIGCGSHIDQPLKNEELNNTALREANEEVGIIPENVDIIGKLTPLPVPVSNYLIHPFVGIISGEPKWKINEEEVEELIILKLNHLIEADNSYSEVWKLRDTEVKVPIFKVMEKTVWGATATVLCELLDLIKE